MTINSISSQGSVLATHAAPSGPRPGQGPGGAFEAVSDLLGMSADDIAAAVSSGTSLMDLAEQKGVSSEDLLTTLEDNAPAELQGADDLREIVTQIATQTGAPDGPGGPGGPPPGRPPGPPPSGVLTGNLTDTQSTTLETVSSLLEMSGTDLADALENGESLVDLLSEKGIDLSELASALESSFAGSGIGFQVDVRL